MRREALFLMLHSHVPRYMIPNQEKLQSTMAVRTAMLDLHSQLLMRLLAISRSTVW